VLSNLVTNAIRYSSGERILVTCRGQTEQFSFRVYDQGPGLSAEELRRVMQPERSVRLSPQNAGIGVGLKVCADLAAAYGGRLKAESRPGHGSVFGLVLPMPALNELSRAINFVGDDALWGNYAAMLDRGELTDEHGGESDKVYVFSESIDNDPDGGINVVACYDRSNENRDRWSKAADAILCFPVTLPALAYAAALAIHRSALKA